VSAYFSSNRAIAPDFIASSRDMVRVVSVGDVSKELCGGTHCRASGEIGLFKIVHETAVSKGVRRIEAKTGIWAYEYVAELERILKESAGKLGVPFDELPKKIDDLKSRKTASSGVKFDDKRVKNINGLKVYMDIFDGENLSDLRHLGDVAKAKMKSGIVILFDKKKDRVNVIVMVTKDLVGRFKAKEIVIKISSALGGKGGGKEDFAQGGGKELGKLDDTLNISIELEIATIKKYLRIKALILDCILS